MITSQLISYIRKQIQNNISKDLIISKLMEAGWHIEDIDEGFLNVESEFSQKAPSVKKVIEDSFSTSKENKEVIFADKYHEPIEGENIFKVEMKPHRPEVFNLDPKIESKTEPVKIETPKIEIPIVAIPKITVPIVETPKVEERELDIFKTELPKAETAKVGPSKTDSPKVWVPMSVPVKENIIKILPIVNTGSQVKKEEHNLISIPKKPTINSFDSINKKESEKSPSQPVAVTEDTTKNSLANNLPKIAMLSSYKTDIMSLNRTIEEVNKKNKSKLIKRISISFFVIVLLGIVSAFASGYIKIENLNLPFIKKDPKVLLINNSKVLSSLKSYKTETNIGISSPSFANITYGLVSGEAVSSPDKDTFSINTLGVINQNGKGLISDNFITIKSSLLQDYITTDIKNNGTDLFVSVPDLSRIIKNNAPESSMVKINEKQFDLIPSLFSPNIELQLKKINIYKILSSGIPSYVNNETLSAYDEFINNVEIMEKGQENIKGIDTYHYSINADRQITKKLLTKITNSFMLNLSSEDKDRLAQVIGSASVDSFDVWIGKNDNNIYQYNIVLDIPLSKIIGFEDKSIGDNQIKVSWKTTYYDFNISNNVIMPEKSTPITEFVNSVKEIKMKNEISSLKQFAINLFKTEGGYGKNSNTSGSCMSPTFGSLFSPTGHNKGAATAVSSISKLMNEVLGITNGVGTCYSTPKAWSFSIPISDSYNPSTPTAEYQHFFCVDNTGAAVDLITPQTGVICK